MKENTYMRRAAELAGQAAEKGDVPVGAVVVKDSRIIGEGFNTRQCTGDISGHAEINALRKAAEAVGTWRLENCELYVTLEPCPMCAAAIAAARIKAVHFGAYDKRAGAVESMMRLYDNPLEHRPAFYGGIMEEETSKMLTDFFSSKRNKAERKG